MPISKETRQRKPWRVDGLPRISRLSAPQLRRTYGRIGAMLRQRVPTIDGKRTFRAISDQRCRVMQHVVREVGFRGRNQLYISEIAAGCDAKPATVQRTLEDAEAMGVLRRHPVYRPTEDGSVRRDASIFELIAPPEPESQSDRGSGSIESILSVRRRRAERRAFPEVTLLTVHATDPPPDPEKARAVAAKYGW